MNINKNNFIQMNQILTQIFVNIFNIQLEVYYYYI